MKLQGRNLAIRMKGKDVGQLQSELSQLGFVIRSEETDKQYFGRETRDAVQAFERRQGLPVTVTVDKRIADAINAAVAALPPESRHFVVKGEIRYQDSSPPPAMKVEVVDYDMRSHTLLGEQMVAASREQPGHYEVHYTADQFRRAEKGSADLVVRVSSEGVQLAESETHFNVPPVVTIDLEVAPEPQLSEIELLELEVDQVREEVEYADFTDEDITFLAKETGRDRQHIEFLRQATRLSRETGLVTEAGYGWARQGLSLELDALLIQPPDRLRSALETAIDENIIPAKIRESLDEIMGHLEQLKFERGLLVAREVVGQLLNQETEKPLAGLTVHAVDLDAEGEPKDLGYDISDRRGRFVFVYIIPSQTPLEEEDRRQRQAERRIRLHILDPQGEEVHQTEIRVQPEQQEIIAVRVPVPETPEPADIAVMELASTLEFNIPDGLTNYLADQDIHTLADIRRAGGIARLVARLEEPPVPIDHQSVQLLDAHANLIRLSDDLKYNQQKLVERGYTNILAIASKTRADFVRSVAEEGGEFKAAQLQVKALAQTHVLNNILTGLTVDYPNGVPYAGQADFELESPETQPPIPTLSELYTRKCSCKDCEAAVSPLAYLADLLDYALTHVKNNGSAITLSWLANTFHQPFGDLPASCEEMDRKVRQVRICIEVLRSYLKAVWSSLPQNVALAKEEALAKQEKTYLLKAYTTLLTKIGTSYEDIRLAQNADEDTRAGLADRLGIDLDLNGIDPLSQIFFDATAPETLTEADLEKLFGLVDTTRDPLSEGVKEGDDQNQITRWNFNGAEWNRNTDVDGVVYLSLEKESATAHRVRVFRDPQRTELVALSNQGSAKGSVTLSEKNASGLSGSCDIDYTANSDTIQISVIPAFLSWRLRHLRTLWRQQDWPSDAYAEDAENPLPIIDPDVIGPDDFRNPVSGNPAFDLWHMRRTWVDAQLQALSSLTHEVNGQEVPDMAAMFTAMYQPVTYEAVSVTPWANTTLPADFDTLHENLTQGTDTEATKLRIESDLNLTVEGFTRLMAIRAKDQLAPSDPEVEPVTDEEWREVYSILVQAQKRALFPDWINEEAQAGIELGPKQFWLSPRAPVEGDWPPVPVEHPLPHAYPLIDPEELKLDDLPEPTAGQDAIALYQVRRTTLDQIYQDLKAEREANGFEAMLKHALGDPNPGDPLPPAVADLNTLNDDLNSSNPNTAADAKAKVQNHLYMTVDDFTRLMEIKAKADQSDAAKKPTTEEWAEVYAILTTAQKVKREFPNWIGEETQAGMDVAYWKAVKARLPLWRALAEVRQGWQQALRTRNQPPLIDPDLIGPGDLQNPESGDAAYDLWKTRRNWVESQLTTLSALPKDLTGFDTIVENTLGVPATDLVDLDEQQEEGNSITARLEQLTLPRDAFSYLLRLRDLLDNNAPVLDSEWQDVYSILVQVQKRREFAEWREQERTQNLILAPEHFKIPSPPSPPQFPPPEPEPLPAWRAHWRDRGDWQDKLESRMDQEQAIIEALQEAVSTTEEETLPILRDALVKAINQPGDFDAKAKWVTDYLLIDARAAGCQMTTRIAQAIETIQGLLWSVRTDQLEDTYPGLELDADDFDEEWKWIGSYATWRSAMFVFLYPENILMPGLRRRQTPAFQQLVKDLRRNRRLTPEDACEAAKAYSDYFRDVCTLTVEATCQANTRLHNKEGCSRMATGYSQLFYMFGRGKATKSVYWSAYDPQDESGYAQTFWEPIPGLDNVTDLVGSVPYDMGDDQRYIFLFALARENGERKLVFSRYDLERQLWDTEPYGEPELPPESGACTVVAVQKASEDEPPELAIYSGDRLYVRSLNPEASDWQAAESDSDESSETADEWESFTKFLMADGQKLHAVVEPQSGHQEFGLTLPDGALAFALDNFGGSSWVGVVPWRQFGSHVFYEDGGQVFTRLIPAEPGYTESGETKESMAHLSRIAPNYGGGPSKKKHIAYHRTGIPHTGVYRALVERPEDVDEELPIIEDTRVAPRVTGPFDIVPGLPDAKVSLRGLVIWKAFDDNADGPESTLIYLREAYYFVPMLLALQLQKRGEFTRALDWFRTVYDYSAPVGYRKIYYGLVQEESQDPGYEREDEWLLDPLDPHAIAATRRNTYTRFTLLSLVRCFLQYADAEFTRDTAESVARARTLYLTALELLDDDALKQQLGTCEEMIGQLKIEVGDPQWNSVASEIKSELSEITDIAQVQTAIGLVETALSADEPWEVKFAKARAIIAEKKANRPAPPTFDTVLQQRSGFLKKAQAALLTQDAVSRVADAAGQVAANDFLHAVSLVSGMRPARLERRGVALPWLRAPMRSRSDASVDAASDGDGRLRSGLQRFAISRVDTLRRIAADDPLNATKITRSQSGYYVDPRSYQFCIPPNPVIEFYRLHAELNLYKLRSCRNIAGMERQLDPYAAPTDTVTGLPMIGVGGQLVLPGIATPPPTPYRYSVLIERAKQLVQLAIQVESAMLSALEKRDAEYYNFLKARQDVQITRQGVRLQDLHLKAARHGVKLAELQRDRAQIQVDKYSEWIEAGLNEWELDMIEAYGTAALYRKIATALGGAVAAAQAAAAAQPWGAGAVATVAALSAASSSAEIIAIGEESEAQIASIYASYERRKDEWELQKSLAAQDFAIGGQQVKIANDQVRVVGQERKIAEMQADHAKETIEFLANKFTNVELYDWMSDVLEGVYSFFLEHATAMAKLAENQLAFERQETPPAIIQADYWEAPAGMEIGGDPHSAAPDRRGLTGSARLLQDIYQLDQYAFETDKRKLQLTKTISLAQLAPVEFQRFRETGVLPFATPMQLFDRDFPGHYIRLIKRVRTSVVALIPPTAGVHATLSTTGLSRVAIGGGIGLFQTVPVKTPPESVALTSPVNATGLFELTPQPQEMLLPFEGMGVDTSWEFRMPKASNLFDYSTIANVLITIEYTALNNFDYGQLVIQELDAKFSADRPFSFRHQFADQWYHLHNPEQTATPMTVKFQTRREDFPPNVENLKVQHVVLYFARKDGASFEVPVTHLHLIEQGNGGTVGGGATSIDGIMSTRRGNAGSWTPIIGKSPAGEWELALPNTVEIKNRFKNEEIEDILFVITYSGRTPEWPG